MAQAPKNARSRGSLGSLALFDLTGALTYILMRRLLAVRKPDPAPIEPFRASARTLSSAHRQAAGTTNR
jgi:hypothetical protein